MISKENFEKIKFMNMTSSGDFLFGVSKSQWGVVVSERGKDDKRYDAGECDYECFLNEMLQWFEKSSGEDGRLLTSLTVETAMSGDRFNNIFNPLRFMLRYDVYLMGDEIVVSYENPFKKELSKSEDSDESYVIFEKEMIVGKKIDGKYVLSEPSEDMKKFISEDYVQWTLETMNKKGYETLRGDAIKL